MKKYTSLAELLVDYRRYHRLSQIDFAGMLDVDVRTILRWEKSDTYIKPEKEKLFIENLGIPRQVIRNLNTDHPIATYFDLNLLMYSNSGISQKMLVESRFNFDQELQTDRIRRISSQADLQSVTDIQTINKNRYTIRHDTLKAAATLLPGLNLVLHDHSGFYAGHISVIPLKLDMYEKLKNREYKEGQILPSDLSADMLQQPLVFYFYSLYADSTDNAYYLLNRLLNHFKQNKYGDYIFGGISRKKSKIELLKDMGLQVVWEIPPEAIQGESEYFLEGNFDKYLFGG